MNENLFDTIECALKDLRQGKCVVVVDSEERENEGDLIVAAEYATAEMINFFVMHGRGLVCVCLTEERMNKLKLNQMVDNNTALLGTKFSVSVDAISGTTTGISASDRAMTIKVLLDDDSKPEDLGRPGHIFPIQAVKGGVLNRVGHTEATVDLARLAGFKEAGVLCEIMNDDGSMARVPQLAQFAKRHNLKLISVKDLIRYRQTRESRVEKITTVDLPTKYGDFELRLFKSELDNQHHLALVKGEISSGKNILVRIHSSCLTGDVFGSCRCDCGGQLHRAMEMIEREKEGIILYMRQEGRGIGLVNKLLAYKLQEQGRDTVEANRDLGFDPDQRDYSSAAMILKSIGVSSVRLLTNNPDKINALRKNGIEVTERISLEVNPTKFSRTYLTTKRDKLGHFLNFN